MNKYLETFRKQLPVVKISPKDLSFIFLLPSAALKVRVLSGQFKARPCMEK